MEIEYSKSDLKNLLTFNLRDLARTSIRSVVDELMAASHDLSTLLRPPPGQKVWHFEAVCRFPDGTCVTEKEIWERASDFVELHDSAVSYARNVSMPGTDPAGTPLWHDEWHPVGCYAIAPLTFKDTRYFAALIDLARASDLEHADIYTPWIHLLLRHHGWQQDTKRLLAHRCGPLRGGDGMGSLGLAVHDLGFREWLVSQGELESFPDEVGALVGDQRADDIVAEVREILFVGNDAAYGPALLKARARSADMIERFPGKLHYAKYRYAKVAWNEVPEPGGR